MRCPLPLAAIAIRRDLADVRGAGFRSRARSQCRAMRSRILMPAANMSRTRAGDGPAVVAKHIELYVNDYTLALDEAAVHANARLGGERCPAHATVPSTLSIFI